MLNMEQQADLNGLRNSVKVRAARLYPHVDVDARNDILSMGMAAMHAFFKEHPAASADSVMEYYEDRLC